MRWGAGVEKKVVAIKWAPMSHKLWPMINDHANGHSLFLILVSYFIFTIHTQSHSALRTIRIIISNFNRSFSVTANPSFQNLNFQFPSHTRILSFHHFKSAITEEEYWKTAASLVNTRAAWNVLLIFIWYFPCVYETGFTHSHANPTNLEDNYIFVIKM